jgi:hypothetical protein
VSDGEVQVTIHVTSPPSLGGAAIQAVSTENFSVSWKIKKTLVPQFGKALNSRNLVGVLCSLTLDHISDHYTKEYRKSGK